MINTIDSWWIGKHIQVDDGPPGEIIFVHSDNPEKGFLKCDVLKLDGNIVYVQLVYRHTPKGKQC